MVTKDKFFYGYWIVLAGCIAIALHSGFGFYGFSVLNKPIADEFHWSRSTVTAAFFIYSIAVAGGSLFVGRLTDKRGPRQVFFIGTVTMSLALLLLSWTSALWNFYLVHLFLGLGVAILGPVPISINISNWFYRLRGTMQGIAFVGVGIGGVVMAPLLGNYLIPSLGWRGAYLFMAFLLSAIMLPLIFFVVKDHPRQKGLRTYGQEAVTALDSDSKTEEAIGHSFKEALGTLSYWLIVLTAAVYGMSCTAAMQNQVSILTEQSFTATEAVVAIGGIGLFSGVGKLFFGYLCDHTDPKYAAALSYTLVGFSLVAMIQASSMAHVWVYAALMGLGMGGWAPNLAMLSVNYFGLKHFGSVLGSFRMLFLTGEAIGPVLAGFVYDQTGSYRPVLTVLAILCLVSVPLIAVIKKPKSPRTEIP